MKIYRIFPMSWYDTRGMRHRTVYGITPEPADLAGQFTCESADPKDPLWQENKHYNRLLLEPRCNYSYVDWNNLLEWLSKMFDQGYTLFPQDKFPLPNCEFMLQRL